jgi:hypothetical protein
MGEKIENPKNNEAKKTKRSISNYKAALGTTRGTAQT